MNVKLLWKGQMNEKNMYTYQNMPPNAKNLFSERGNWEMYFLIIPVLAFAYVGIRVRLHYVTGIMFTKWGLIIGVVISVLFLVIHELIHAICCPRTSTVLVYAVPLGICVIPTSPLRKSRYIFMAIMPTIILGVCPFCIWLCFPSMGTLISSILFGFSIGNLSMCIGDIYNIILAVLKMTSKSYLITSGKSCYYFEDM